MTGPGDELSGFAKAYRSAGPWLNASAKLTSAPAVGVAVGWWIDSTKGSAPWGVLIGALVGMTLGFVGFITDVLRMSKKKDDADQK
jgi:ATP synthase protein I